MNDYEWMKKAWEARKNARCVKQLGTVLVSSDDDDVEIFSIGYNGAPFGMEICTRRLDECPRKDSISGEDLERCSAVHAEMFPILEFAKRGISTKGATLYCSFGVPCKDCMKEIINCGIKKIVVTRMTFYDNLSKIMLSVFLENGGEVVVLDVVQCPRCNSLNANGIGTLGDGRTVRCGDCRELYNKKDTDIFVGDGSYQYPVTVLKERNYYVKNTR